MEPDLIQVWDEYYGTGAPLYYSGSYQADVLNPLTLLAIDWGEQGEASIAWDVYSDSQIAELTDIDVESVSAFSLYGEFAAVAAPGEIVVWNVYSEILCITFPYDEQETVTRIVWSPDGNLIAAGMESNAIYVWETVVWQEVATVESPGCGAQPRVYTR